MTSPPPRTWAAFPGSGRGRPIGSSELRLCHESEVVHVGPGVCILTPERVAQALALRDLSDEAQGVHAINLLVREIAEALQARYELVPEVHRGSRIVSIEENYDRLYYPPDGAARDSRYTRYVGPRQLLRTQMTQMDVWLLVRRRVGREDLLELIQAVLHAGLPGCSYRCSPATHPYTVRGLQVDVRDRSGYTEVLECGEILPQLLDGLGLHSDSNSGLALGMGLDRLVMLRKGIDDIRLLRSPDPRIAGQMKDLARYRPVSRQPSVRRNLSVAVAADLTPEEIGDRVRAALGGRAEQVEEVAVIGETSYDALTEPIRERLGMTRWQKNAFVCVTIRDPARSLAREETNDLARQVYQALHQGRRGYL
jgi:phenylalanyl-tRNA synthetase alpha chain